VNHLHQLATDTATLVHGVNENTSDYITVETSSASNIFALYCYENLASFDKFSDGFRSKAFLNLSNHVS